MLLQAFNEPDFLPNLTGLADLYKQGEAALEQMDWDAGNSEDGFEAI